MSPANLRRSQQKEQQHYQKFVTTMAIMSLATVFFGMQLMMVGPLKDRLDSIQSRLDLTELDMRKLVSARNQVWQTNDLLSSLQEQSQHLSSTRQTLKAVSHLQAEIDAEAGKVSRTLASLNQIADLQKQLVAQSEQTQMALAQLDQLVSMRKSLVNESENIDTAVATLDDLVQIKQDAINAADNIDVAQKSVTDMTEIKTTIVNNITDIDSASDGLNNLVAVKDSVIAAADKVEVAKEKTIRIAALTERLNGIGNVQAASDNADDLISLGHALSDEDLQVDAACTNLASLLDIENGLKNKSSDIAQAVESLEIMADFRADLDKHIRSLDGFRRTMVEIAMMETTVGRAASILQPLVELGTLRRLSSTEVRDAARHILANRDPGGSKKTTTVAENTNDNLVPQPRDLEE